ncbi:hypothetical protein C8J56DRAFT_1160355 [Mycena floridula]|nr:hypothetical protein C8J56DRAFT_1160355 [Mycena floridula]
MSSSTKRRPAARKEKIPTPVPERLKRHFASLCAQIDGGHFSNALKTCEKILRLEPNDPDALKTKVYLYLQTDQYNAALALIEANGPDFQPFEKAYALYRLQNLTKAREVLDKCKGSTNDMSVLHLEAQLNYREGRYEEAVDLYTQLLDTTLDPEEQSDIQTNILAAQKHLDFINTDYLRSLDALSTSLTVTIEEASPPTVAPVQVSSKTADEHDEAPTAKAKKTRKRRVPAGVIPGVTPPPDPERWLKKSERTVQPGRKRKGAGGGGATQGMTMDAPASVSKSSGKSKKKK